MALAGEEWREVPGYPEFLASSHGRIAKVRGYMCRNGYEYVHAGGSKQVPAHRLVAFAFHGTPKHVKLTVNHIDGNRKNNRPENLEWLSYGDNHRHAYQVLGRKPIQPYKLRGKLAEVKNMWDTGKYSFSSLGRVFGVRGQTVKRALEQFEREAS